MTTVALYTRAGCHLCEAAREILIRAQARHGFELHERDIEADERLLHRFLERIPVVAIDGVEAFELFVDESELEQRLGRVGIR